MQTSKSPTIADKIRRLLGLNPRAVPEIHPRSRPELVRLQRHLLETCGGSVMNCPACSGLVTPIVDISASGGIEFPAIACISCHNVHTLSQSGWIVEDEADAAETLH